MLLTLLVWRSESCWNGNNTTTTCSCELFARSSRSLTTDALCFSSSSSRRSSILERITVFWCKIVLAAPRGPCLLKEQNQTKAWKSYLFVILICSFFLTWRCRSKGSHRAATPRHRLKRCKRVKSSWGLITLIFRGFTNLTMVKVPQRQTPHHPRELSRPSPPILGVLTSH